MGLVNSRRRGGSEEIDVDDNAYQYPAKSGNYFAKHFFLGGERFEALQPNSYLFGDNYDLNFLGGKPVPFPFRLTHENEPTKPLTALINIRKDSVRIIKHESKQDLGLYNIEFVFDAELPCDITVYYFAREEFNHGELCYFPKDPSMTSKTYHYEAGLNQTFSQPHHLIEPMKYNEEEWCGGIELSSQNSCYDALSNSSSVGGMTYSVPKDVTWRLPVVILCDIVWPDNQMASLPHQHVTYCLIERQNESINFLLKPLKQKQVVEGVSYLLQEIYGLEKRGGNIHSELRLNNVDCSLEDNGSECVICMSESRDTLILPCRHLCLCASCANSLRYQANNCPICRAPFLALLQLRAVRRHVFSASGVQTCADDAPHVSISPEMHTTPQGYVSLPLLDALHQTNLMEASGGGSSSTAAPSTFTDSVRSSRMKSCVVSELSTRCAPTAAISSDSDSGSTAAATLANRRRLKHRVRRSQQALLVKNRPAVSLSSAATVAAAQLPQQRLLSNDNSIAFEMQVLNAAEDRVQLEEESVKSSFEGADSSALNAPDGSSSSDGSTDSKHVLLETDA